MKQASLALAVAGELQDTHSVVSDDPLLNLARETLSLVGLVPAEDELAVLPVLHATLGPGLAALDELDLATLPAEPDLDPGRAPIAPIT